MGDSSIIHGIGQTSFQADWDDRGIHLHNSPNSVNLQQTLSGWLYTAGGGSKFYSPLLSTHPASNIPVGSNLNINVSANPRNIQQFEFQVNIVSPENYGNGIPKLFVNLYTNQGEGSGSWYGHRFSLMLPETSVASNGVATFVLDPEDTGTIYADNSGTKLADWMASSTGIMGIYLSTGSTATSLQINVQSFSVKFKSGQSISVSYETLTPPATQSCFRKGTLVLTDQETVEIQNIKPNYHTINDKEIKCVTSVYNSDGMVVKIEKDCLGENKPSNTMYMQKDHKLMISPFEFSALLTSGKIQFESSSSDELLYNVLLENHETMMVENIQVETLNPELEISKYFMGDRSKEHKALIENNTEKMIFC
jgi:hypothetical protein